MTVYAIHALRTRFVKVGYTRAATAEHRLASLQVASPHELRVLAWAAGAPIIAEHMAHRKLEHFHVRGEWFALGRAERLRLVDFMQTLPRAADLESDLQRFTHLTKDALRGNIEIEPWRKVGGQ